ncbi:MAG: hypothetical protein ACI9W2_004897 [Gammaproteobacteria bacterium]|jgi:hypothetical protein
MKAKIAQFLAGTLVLLAIYPGPMVMAKEGALLIDDFERADNRSALGTPWRGVSDRVMGGISDMAVSRETLDRKRCLRLTGTVSLENRGGFIQMALDLAQQGGTLDASAFSGLVILVKGNGERYSVHLRTPDAVRPWQSYRSEFTAGPQWTEVRLPFSEFQPHQLDSPLDTLRLSRLGIVAVGRAFAADVALARIALY